VESLIAIHLRWEAVGMLRVAVGTSREVGMFRVAVGTSREVGMLREAVGEVRIYPVMWVAVEMSQEVVINFQWAVAIYLVGLRICPKLGMERYSMRKVTHLQPGVERYSRLEVERF
jgi:hypothetical protein